MSTFWKGFFAPVIGFALLILAITIAVLPILAGYVIQGENFSHWWGVANIIYLLTIRGLITVYGEKLNMRKLS